LILYLFIYGFLVLGVLHDVRGEFTDDVLELTVGPMFAGDIRTRIQPGSNWFKTEVNVAKY
jgi:hypothetical protein